MRSIQACLDEVLAFWLSDQRLQFGGSERIDETGLRDDEEQDLCTSESRQFISLR